jgi:hypothetical protein
MTPLALLGDAFHGGVELGATLAAQGAEGIAGEALGVDADEGGVGADLAHGHGEVGFAVDDVFVHGEDSSRRRGWGC